MNKVVNGFEIISNKEMPAPQRKPKRSKYIDVFEAMNVGDWIGFESKSKGAAFYQAIARLKKQGLIKGEIESFNRYMQIKRTK